MSASGSTSGGGAQGSRQATRSGSVAQWAARFARRSAAPDEPAWLRALRSRAIADFEQQGFPTSRLEDWKHSARAIRPLTTMRFDAPGAAASDRVSRDALEALAFPLFACSLYVFVDGRFSSALSTPRGLSGDLHVRSIAALAREEPGELEGSLGALADTKSDPFAALNTAFFEDGALVHVPRGESIGQPIHLVFLATAAGGPHDTHPRVLLRAEPGSAATVVVDHVSLGDAPQFTNVVIEAAVAEDARIELVQLQREADTSFHVSRTHVQQAGASRMATHVLTLGGCVVRNDLAILLAGEGAECRMNGLFLGVGQQHLDNQTGVDHAVPHCVSEQLYKGVLGGRAHGVFRGRVRVRPDAQQTSAQQSNPNLLLGQGAEISSKPQLEIHADDVRCSHGSTIGQLDPDAFFFLRARGIDPRSAREILTEGFAAQIADALPVPALGARVRELFRERLATSRAFEEARR